MCRSSVLLHLGLGLVLASCGSAPAPEPRAEAQYDPGPALRVDAAELGSLDEELRSTLRADAHQYFRFVAQRFVGVACEIADGGPIVNLQGDAHLEQYLVTSLGRGLGDFDEATTGPVGIDLLRLITSIQIASRMRGWGAAELWARFLEGYLAALEDESLTAPEPVFARRTREAFTDDHAALLRWCESLFTEIDAEESARVEVVLTSYINMLHARRPELDVRHFEVVTIGPHRLGVGSRRAGNYLIRTRGPTDDPGDDLILEAKEVTRNPLAECLPISRRSDPLRILVAESRIAYTPFRDVGFVELDERPYWIHEWVNDYVELDVRDERLSEEEVAEVLYDIGVQLGHGHPRGLGDAFQAELRSTLRQYLLDHARALWESSTRLAEATWAAWEEIR